MSWLDKVLPKISRSNGETAKKDIPAGVWTKCSNCGTTLYAQELRDNLNVCPKCNHHMRVSARQRLDMILDPENRQEIGAEIRPVDPLRFVDSKKYPDRVKQAQSASGETDALVVQSGTIHAMPAVVAVFEFGFMAGSMGSVVGERFARAVQAAIDNQAAFVCFTASGGARMQEGIVSLMQMAKTSGAVKYHSENGGLYITVLTDPTTGGVTASFASLGDIIIAEPKIVIGFAGRRVVEGTIKQRLPDDFQLAEFMQDKGFVDLIVERKKMRSTLSHLLKLHGYTE